MYVATSMSSGRCSISPLRDWEGDICVCVCLCVPVFQFYFHFKEEWAFNMQLRICLSTTLWCPAASVAFERAWVSLSTSNESHVERWLDP